MAKAALVQPSFFIDEDFLGCERTGQFGVLDDYAEYLTFTGWSLSAERRSVRINDIADQRGTQ